MARSRLNTVCMYIEIIIQKYIGVYYEMLGNYWLID